MKKFTSFDDVENISSLLDEIKEIKNTPHQFKHLGQNKTLGLIFFNPSLRTRLSTQVAASNLGMNTIVMNIFNDGWALEFEDGVVMNQNKSEHIKEAARVISQYCDIIGIRSFAEFKSKQDDYDEKVLHSFIKFASVPVISLESATKHPLQSLTDWFTIEEYKKNQKPKVVLTWAPHPKMLPQAVANSFAYWLKNADVELEITHPEGFDLHPKFTGNVKVTHNQNEAFANADFIYAKNWSSFTDYGKIGYGEKYDHWTITKDKMNLTRNAFFMHCLPIRRNVIATDEVIDSPQSLIIPQSKNRLFVAQAILKRILKCI